MPLKHIQHKNASLGDRVAGYVFDDRDYEENSSLDLQNLNDELFPNKITIKHSEFYNIYTGVIVRIHDTSLIIKIDQTGDEWVCRVKKKNNYIGADTEEGFLMGYYKNKTTYHKCPRCHLKKSTTEGIYCKKCDAKTII